MVDVDTFLTELYVMVDDFCKAEFAPARPLGHPVSLSQSEVVTLTRFGTWFRFRTRSDFWRWARRHLTGAFPTLPDRSQFNRRQRTHQEAITAFFCFTRHQASGGTSDDEALDGFGVRVRNAKRRGSGWLAGQADIGWSNRLGWDEGVHVLTAVTPTGVLTGVGVAPASTKDQPYAESFLAARYTGESRVAEVGEATSDLALADKGFDGKERQRHWLAADGVTVAASPTRASASPWPASLRRWQAGLRQIVETVHNCLLDFFSLDRERPHPMDAFRTRLVVRAALHNFRICLNQKLGHPNLAFANLIDW